jgi:hypothetical protein
MSHGLETDHHVHEQTLLAKAWRGAVRGLQAKLPRSRAGYFISWAGARADHAKIDISSRRFDRPYIPQVRASSFLFLSFVGMYITLVCCSFPLALSRIYHDASLSECRT